jgi:cardiolipin synthase
VQYYILRSDKLGLELRAHLVAKAKEGVAVFLLVDNLGSLTLTEAYLRELRAAGVMVAKFLPLRLTLQANFRNHRKLVAVDGEVAYVGGINVGSEYVGHEKAYWRDTHFKLRGPVVARLEKAFLDDWYFAARRKRKSIPFKYVQPAHSIVSQETPKNLQVVSFGPNDQTQVGLLLLMQVINGATKRLWIASPYFIPDQPLERLLELAVIRGVDVRLLIPRKADHAVVQWVTHSYAYRLLSQGIRVFMYERGFMHQKVIQVDDDLTVFGSANFDNRSVYLNFETAILSYSEDFSRQVVKMLDRDFTHASELRGKMKGNWFIRLRSNLAALMSPLM